MTEKMFLKKIKIGNSEKIVNIYVKLLYVCYIFILNVQN